MNQPYKYHVALSFAGENRDQAQSLADSLEKRGLRVFYDQDEKSSLWGKDLYAHLSDLYSNKAFYCVMLLSQDYAIKLWTNHERKAAQERAFRENREYVLPVRLDDTSIPGILPTVGYLSWPPENAESIADAIMRKFAEYETLRPSSFDNIIEQKTNIDNPVIQDVSTRKGLWNTYKTKVPIRLFAYLFIIIVVVLLAIATQMYKYYDSKKETVSQTLTLNNYIAEIKKGIQVTEISIDKARVGFGDTIELSLRISNKTTFETKLWIGASAFSYNGLEFWNKSEDKTVLISPSGSTYTKRFLTLPKGAPVGQYDIQVNLWFGVLGDPTQSERISSNALREIFILQSSVGSKLD